MPAGLLRTPTVVTIQLKGTPNCWLERSLIMAEFNSDNIGELYWNSPVRRLSSWQWQMDSVEPIYQVKLLSALRNGIYAFILNRIVYYD